MCCRDRVSLVCYQSLLSPRESGGGTELLRCPFWAGVRSPAIVVVADDSIEHDDNAGTLADSLGKPLPPVTFVEFRQKHR